MVSVHLAPIPKVIRKCTVSSRLNSGYPMTANGSTIVRETLPGNGMLPNWTAPLALTSQVLGRKVVATESAFGFLHVYLYLAVSLLICALLLSLVIYGVLHCCQDDSSIVMSTVSVSSLNKSAPNEGKSVLPKHQLQGFALPPFPSPTSKRTFPDFFQFETKRSISHPPPILVNSRIWKDFHGEMSDYPPIGNELSPRIDTPVIIRKAYTTNSSASTHPSTSQSQSNPKSRRIGSYRGRKYSSKHNGILRNSVDCRFLVVDWFFPPPCNFLDSFTDDQTMASKNNSRKSKSKNKASCRHRDKEEE